MTIVDKINDIPVGRKLFAGFGIVALLLIIVGYVGVNGLDMAGNDIEEISHTNSKLLEETSHLEIAMLQARQSEKDFFAQKDTNYITQVDNEVDEMVKDARLIQQLDVSDTIHEDAREIEKMAAEYGILFNDVADLEIGRGLTYDTGIQGKVRSLGGDLEDMVLEYNSDGSNNQLYVDLLLLRRHEKDYLLRSDTKYLTLIHDTEKQFREDLEVSDLSEADKRKVNTALDEYVLEMEHLIETDTEIAASTAAFTDKVLEIEPLVMEMQNTAVEEIGIANEEATVEIEAAQSNMLAMAVIALIMAVFSALIITRSITKPVDEMVEATNRIAKGDLTVEITTVSNDELGTLAKSINEMRKSINSAISESRKAVDESSTKVEYLNNIPTPVVVMDKDLTVVFINSAGAAAVGGTPEGVTGRKCYDLFKTPHCHTPDCRVTKAIRNNAVSVGDTIANLPSGQLPIRYTGAPIRDPDGNVVGGIEYVIDISEENRAVAEVEELVAAFVEGKLDARGNPDNYHIEGFRNIVRGMNATLDAVIEPLNMAAEYIDRISNGDIPQKITDEYKGDFNEIKNNLNICIDAINEMIDDINMLSKAVDEGKMYIRADTSKHEGDFRKIVQGMNDTLNAVAEPMLIASDVARKLASSAEELASSAQQMNATTESVSSTVQQIAKGTQNQSVQIGNTSKTMEVMATNVKEVASKSQSAAEISVNASEIAQKGSEAAGNAAVKMSDIQKVVTESGAVVKELGGRSQEIGEIVQMITGIANQTNLLALNAAIEAARAGEAGRGFAVVADEVRNLAEESKQAADKIAVLIKEIQSETDKAVVSMESGTTEVEEGSKIVNEALTALENIAAGSQEVANVILEISAASEQQQTGIENVVKAIDEIAAVAEESAAGTEEASGATEEQTAAMEEVTSQAQNLANMGTELQRALERFIMSENQGNMMR